MPLKFILVLLLCFARISTAQQTDSEQHPGPLTVERITELNKTLNRSLEESTELIQRNPKSLKGYSQRGDAHFFLGQMKAAVADYDKMIELDEKESASHWRRGIALFYAGRYEDAAAQFESYHTYDQIDRENGIWRYLSQRRAVGQKKAREGLLKYPGPDRQSGNFEAGTRKTSVLRPSVHRPESCRRR